MSSRLNEYKNIDIQIEFNGFHQGDDEYSLCVARP